MRVKDTKFLRIQHNQGNFFRAGLSHSGTIPKGERSLFFASWLKNVKLDRPTGFFRNLESNTKVAGSGLLRRSEAGDKLTRRV